MILLINIFTFITARVVARTAKQVYQAELTILSGDRGMKIVLLAVLLNILFF